VTSSYLGAMLPALVAMGLGFGMIFAPATNTATTGVPTKDSGVASALVNTGQQVGGSIGVSVLSTIAASATASYLVIHHAGPQAAAIAATHGYTLAFTISASLLGLGAILAVLMLPSHRRLKELVSEAPVLITTPPPAVTETAVPAPQRRK
jgi:MFS family permease